MKTSSCKAKGRRLQDDICKRLLEHYKGILEEGDLRVAIMGESGSDIKRSPLATKVFPYAIEAKNQQKISIWAALQQAADNCPEGDKPVVIFKRNRSETYVTLKFDDFIDLLGDKAC